MKTPSTPPPLKGALPKLKFAGVGTLPEIYFDAQKGGFLVSNQRGGWMPENEKSMRRRLRKHGLSGEVDTGDTLSPLDEALLEITDKRNIDYAGPLAGFSAGVHDVCGTRVLVVSEPLLVVPAPGEFPILQGLLDGLFDDDDHAQSQYFLGWLRVALESLRLRIFRPGQALVLAGPKKCGKSLLQNLVTELLGGRNAKPYQFMTQATQFNGDLFEAEHLMIEDEASSSDLRSRRAFGAYVKQFTSAITQRCHPKGRAPLTLTPFWRLSVSVNEEPENLMVLPPIDESLEDKIILLRTASHPMPMPTSTLEEQDKFWKVLMAELPAFVHWLLNDWEIPAAIRGDRFGVAHFLHPDLLRAINDLAPETRLLSLIDEVIFTAPAAGGTWEGTAAELQRELETNTLRSKEVQHLLNYNSACGMYLTRLKRRGEGKRIDSRTLHGRCIYTISAPLDPSAETVEAAA